MPSTDKPPILRWFGSAVRQRRRRLGLSQEALSDVAGIHRTYLVEIERGSRNVSLINVERLARALGVPVSDFFEGFETDREVREVP
jgi:transcriptional regulator with XRE-family HTH domain